MLRLSKATLWLNAEISTYGSFQDFERKKNTVTTEAAEADIDDDWHNTRNTHAIVTHNENSACAEASTNTYLGSLTPSHEACFTSWSQAECTTIICVIVN